MTVLSNMLAQYFVRGRTPCHGLRKVSREFADRLELCSVSTSPLDMTRDLANLYRTQTPEYPHVISITYLYSFRTYMYTYIQFELENLSSVHMVFLEVLWVCKGYNFLVSPPL